MGVPRTDEQFGFLGFNEKAVPKRIFGKLIIVTNV